MAAGDLISNDYEIELRTTLMGGDTTNFPIDYERGSLSGLVDVVTSQAETPFAHADGSYIGESRDAARTVTIAIVVEGSTATATGDNLETMRTVWAPASAAIPLYFQLPGFGKQYVNGWPLGITADIRNLPFGHVPILASFRITDPTIYT